MAVARDASSVSASSASQASFSWTHTPTGTPRGITVFVFNISSSTDTATSVTYGGVTVPAVTGGRAVDTATEPGSCKVFHLGDNTIPTGAQTVLVTRTNNADTMYGVAITQTAAANTAVHLAGIVLLQEDGTVAEQSVTDGSPGVNSVRFAGGYWGHQTLPATGSSSTAEQSVDAGANGWSVVRETTAGQGARNVG